MRMRMQQEKAVKNFERGYMALYNQKPSGKRKSKINRLLQEQQDVLKKERILVGPEAFLNAMHANVTAKQRQSRAPAGYPKQSLLASAEHAPINQILGSERMNAG